MTNGVKQNFTELPEQGVQPSDVQAASPQAPDQADDVASATTSSVVLPDFIELTSEDGLAVLVAKASIALVRQAGANLGNTKAIIILRSGAGRANCNRFRRNSETDRRYRTDLKEGKSRWQA